MPRFVPLLLLAALLLGGALPAQAAPALFRAYYSPLFAGSVSEAPIDPDGDFEGEKVTAPYGAVEVILFGHVGLSGVRRTVLREWRAGDTKYNEKAVELSYNLTLYPWRSMHDSFNAFLGGGQGEIEKYRFKVDGQKLHDDDLHNHMPLERYFAGIEYTFDRIGIRFEVSRMQAENTLNDGRTASVEHTLQNISFYIPLN